MRARIERGEIILLNDTKLIIDGAFIRCFDSDGKEWKLTAGQQKFINKLQLESYQASYEGIFEAYSPGKKGALDDDTIRDNVVKMRSTFPKCIKSNIIAIRGTGYQLKVKNSIVRATNYGCEYPADSLLSQSKHNVLTYLLGDYYGYYLDPTGIGDILGACIHIENMGDTNIIELKAYAVLGLCNEQRLYDDEIIQIFREPSHDYKGAYNAFYEKLSRYERNCIWAQGEVHIEGNLVTIDLNMSNSVGKWSVVFDLKDYIESQEMDESASERYPGGLGLAVASRTKDGTYSFRLGLIEKELSNPTLHTFESNEMKQQLKIIDGSREAEWKPLKLSNFLDKQWRKWIMKKK